MSATNSTAMMWTIRPWSRRILTGGAQIFAFPSRKVPCLSFSDRILHADRHYYRFLESITVRSSQSAPDQSRWDKDGVFRISPSINTSSTIANAVSGARRHSTAVDQAAVAGDKAFEKIYMQGNAQPLVIEEDKDVVKEVDLVAAVKEVEVEHKVGEIEEEKLVEEERVKEKEVSEVEKEAWRLLNKAVVSYCGSPLGTVAANDPLMGNLLNYDQVFIRDFVPSALAFLFKGEGEIVRNFLLHTLQLQVNFDSFDRYLFCDTDLIGDKLTIPLTLENHPISSFWYSSFCED